ncbi:MAG: O-antigen ligase family protein [Opitutaceae bacterium]
MLSPQKCDASASRVSSFGESLQAGLISANLAWSTLCLGGYRPETQVVGYSLTAALVIVHLALRAFHRTTSERSFGVGDWMLGAFLAYAAVNAAWVSPVPWLGWVDFLCWAQLLAVYWIVRSGLCSAASRRFIFGTVLTLAIVSVALGYYQRFVNPEWLMLGRTQVSQFTGRVSGSFGIPNSLAALIMLVLPATVALAVRPGAGVLQRILFGYLGALLVSGFFMTLSRGGWLALALALAAWPLLRSRASLHRRLVASAGLIAAAALVVTALYFVSPGTRARLDAAVRDSGESSRPIMWKAAWSIFRDSPWLGGGAGSFNTLFEKYRPEACQREPQWAHNEYLNTLSDYGIVGFALLFGGACVLVFRSVDRPRAEAGPCLGLGGAAFHPWVIQGMGIGLLGFALQLFVDFHFKLPALAMAFAAIAGIVTQTAKIHAPVDGAKQDGLRRIILSLAALGCAAVFMLVFLPLLRAEAIRYVARQRIDKIALADLSDEQRRVVLRESQAAMDCVLSLYPSHAQAWADLSYIESLWSREQPSDTLRFGRLAEQSARRALSLSSEFPESWVRLGVALDMQGKWLEAGQQYIEALTRAPSSVNMRYYLAFHYSLRPTTYENARALIDTCLRLDPSHAPAQALHQQLASNPDAH